MIFERSELFHASFSLMVGNRLERRRLKEDLCLKIMFIFENLKTVSDNSDLIPREQ